ncbi:hypothetical protein NP233_g12315 [Leucocoprinus birnbaumii]|uniref:Elongation of fatty acids protein n=1 Tax=Leucocoprinus birnbaumii TaxID=56174 RepID=A0AAD5YJJ8_9AGAR|nr:hypothetical protein NP233_g12315 [Leucocoprinus birnbaumii]
MENCPGNIPHSSFSKLTKAVKASKGKKRKSKTTYELYLEFAHWVARSINPYIDFHNVWTIGLASLDGSKDDESSDDEETGLSATERAQCLFMFKKLKSEIPNFMEMVDLFYAKPNILKDLAAQMTSAARQARTTDVSGLKEIGLDYVKSMLPEGRFNPDIDVKSLKSETRGWNHKQIAGLLLPVNLIDEFNEDPDNSLILLVYKHIFTCPSSASSVEWQPTKTRQSQAEKHRLTKETPSTIAYTCLQTYFMLSSADDWRNSLGPFCRKTFFNTVLDLFAKEDEWTRSTLDYFTRNALSHLAHVKAPQRCRDPNTPNNIDCFRQQAEQDVNDAIPSSDDILRDFRWRPASRTPEPVRQPRAVPHPITLQSGTAIPPRPPPPPPPTPPPQPTPRPQLDGSDGEHEENRHSPHSRPRTHPPSSPISPLVSSPHAQEPLPTPRATQSAFQTAATSIAQGRPKRKNADAPKPTPARFKFFDTVFLALKKKPLKFIHVYHHAITAWGFWLGLNEKVSGIPIAINLAIHVVMYYYYNATLSGARFWWKKYLTTVQITQFVIDLLLILFSSYEHYVHTHHPHLPHFGDCFVGNIEGGQWIAVLILASFLLLFGDFYNQTYKKRLNAERARFQTKDSMMLVPLSNSKKVCWRWGHTTNTCQFFAPRCPICSGPHRAENHRDHAACCKAKPKAKPPVAATPSGEPCPHGAHCINCGKTHPANDRRCPFWHHCFDRPWIERCYSEKKKSAT